jgi:hypothetical protein
MSGTNAHPRQAPIAIWVAQIVGTLVVAAVVLAFVRSMGAPFATVRYDLHRYALWAIVASAVPAVSYLRAFKPRLAADMAAVGAGGAPDPRARAALMRSLAIGGALCELPMALGALDLFLGGETRLFVGATMVTIAIRLSYRPFMRSAG